MGDSSFMTFFILCIMNIDISTRIKRALNCKQYGFSDDSTNQYDSNYLSYKFNDDTKMNSIMLKTPDEIFEH